MNWKTNVKANTNKGTCTGMCDAVLFTIICNHYAIMFLEIIIVKNSSVLIFVQIAYIERERKISYIFIYCFPFLITFNPLWGGMRTSYH